MLNVPVDRRGLIASKDSLRLMEFRKEDYIKYRAAKSKSTLLEVKVLLEKSILEYCNKQDVLRLLLYSRRIIGKK